VRRNEAKNLLKIQHIAFSKAANSSRFERRFAQKEPEKIEFCAKRARTCELRGCLDSDKQSARRSCQLHLQRSDGFVGKPHCSCHSGPFAVILSEAKDLALSVFNAVRDSSSPAALLKIGLPPTGSRTFMGLRE
jgi:hypothetical protein